jgi:excisionase family DNA binding protein
MVRELYARGQAERARAIEAILAQALGVGGSESRAATEYLTFGQVGRALGVSAATVEDWVASGQLPATRLGRRRQVPWAAIEPFLDRLRERQRSQSAPMSADDSLAREQHAFVVTGLPAERVARLEALLEKLQDGRRISRDEREELAQLEQEVAAIAGDRLGEWIRQTECDPSAP